MCVTATILAASALVSSAAGTAVSISSAKNNARLQKFAIDQQNKQIQEEREIAKLQAQEAEVARLDEFRRQRAANLSAIAASGVGQNISFLEGIAPAEERALRTDLRNIRMGNLTQSNRLADQIRVNQLSRQVVGINARNQVIGAVAGFVGDVATVGTAYNKTKTPSAGG